MKSVCVKFKRKYYKREEIVIYKKEAKFYLLCRINNKIFFVRKRKKKCIYPVPDCAMMVKINKDYILFVYINIWLVWLKIAALAYIVSLQRVGIYFCRLIHGLPITIPYVIICTFKNFVRTKLERLYTIISI